MEPTGVILRNGLRGLLLYGGTGSRPFIGCYFTPDFDGPLPISWTREGKHIDDAVSNLDIVGYANSLGSDEA